MNKRQKKRQTTFYKSKSDITMVFVNRLIFIAIGIAIAYAFELMSTPWVF